MLLKWRLGMHSCSRFNQSINKFISRHSTGWSCAVFTDYILLYVVHICSKHLRQMLIYFLWNCLQRITCTFNSLEQKRLLMDLDVNMRTGSCPYAVQFYGALFREVGCSCFHCCQCFAVFHFVSAFNSVYFITNRMTNDCCSGYAVVHGTACCRCHPL